VPSLITAFVALRISKRSRLNEATKEVVRRRHEVLEDAAQRFEEHQNAMRAASIAAGYLPQTGPPEARVFRAEDEAAQAKTFALLLEAEGRLTKAFTRLHLHKLLGCESVLAEYIIASAKFRDSHSEDERKERQKMWEKSIKHCLETLTRTYDEVFMSLGVQREMLSGRFGEPADEGYFLPPQKP
jgi:hypothetical protein